MVLAAIMGGSALTASADPWGNQTGDTGAHPDEDPHGYCYSPTVSADLKSGINEAMWDAMDPTQVNVNYDGDCKLSGGGETDVVWRQGNLAEGVSGKAPCEDYDNDRCDQYYLTLDLGQINKGSHDEIDQAQTACHELGHSGGLTHGGSSTDCMINSGSTPPTGIQFRRYGKHHTQHLNDWF
ncbi:hypothetical protein GCM10010191_51720 [Actinomadura vinacea]|uniref:Matrixin family metalloprotease n=2 Tax=Actinomadura vinacea TaxID=115336 RepID=A0ABP5WRD9_9ACTN